MAAVDVVWRLSGLVGPVQQAAIFGVSEEELGQAAAPPPDGDVEGRVSFLQKTPPESFKLLKFLFIYLLFSFSPV